MADPKPETVVPIRDADPDANADADPEHAATGTEQEINPWDVHAAYDDQGNVLAFDYVAISKYVVVEGHAIANRRIGELT